MELFRSCISIKRIIIFYGVLSVAFYLSVLTGCSVELTLPSPNHRNGLLQASNIFLMVLAGLCIASSIFLVIGILVESNALILVWLVSISTTNVYTLLHTYFSLENNETVLRNMSFDCVMAAVFSIGIVIVTYKYRSIKANAGQRRNEVIANEPNVTLDNLTLSFNDNVSPPDTVSHD